MSNYCKWKLKSSPSVGDMYIDCSGSKNRLIDRVCHVCGKHVWIFGGPASEKNSRLSNTEEVSDE